MRRFPERSAAESAIARCDSSLRRPIDHDATTNAPKLRPVTDDRTRVMHGEGLLACSREQEGLWLLEQTRDVGASNNVPVAVELRGAVDLAAAQQALCGLMARHSPLRAEFVVRAGRLFQRDRSPSNSLIQVRDAERSQVWNVVRELAGTRIDILSWPPFRAWLVRCAPDRHILCLIFHHCAFDGASIDVALRDFTELYSSLVERRRPSLPELAANVYAYLAGEEERIAALDERARAHWEPTLARLDEAARIPPFGISGARDAPAYHQVPFELDERLRMRLDGLAASRHASLFAVVLTSLQLLQHRYSGATGEGVATAIAMDARPPELREAVGMFANEAPVLAFPSDDVPFVDYLDEVWASAGELFGLARYPFTLAKARFGRAGESVTADAQTAISYVRCGDSALQMSGLEIGEPRVLLTLGARRPLTLTVLRGRRGIRMTMHANGTVIAADIASAMARDLQTMLSSIVADPRARLRDLRLMDDRKRRRMFAQGTGCCTPAA